MSDNFTPGDILQGRLGNCYFLSAIAGIAECPYRIKKVFSSTTMNENGIYMARVLFKGVYQEVVVDDYFPCSEQGVLLGAQPAGGKEIWVMVVEKAWAKLHGSYDIIDGKLSDIQVGCRTNLSMPFQQHLPTTIWSNSINTTLTPYSARCLRRRIRMRLYAVGPNLKL